MIGLDRSESMNQAIAAAGILLFAVVTILDVWTGPDISSSLFYLAPILVLSLFGKRAGFAAAFVGAVLWFLIEHGAGHIYQHPSVAYWNALVRLGIFLLVAYLFASLRAHARDLKNTSDEIIRLANIKTEFAATVSHELRTPLTVIKEGIAIVKEGIAGPVTKEQMDYLDMVSRNAERLSRLINDVLDFQKLETGSPSLRLSSLDANELILSVVNSFKHLAEQKGLTIETSLADDLLPVQCDKDKIEQVMFNLLNNAISFSDKGVVLVSTAMENGMVRVAVQDEGIGISPENVSKLFQAFVQLSPPSGRKVGGSGLGLAISKKIVEGHGGSLGVESSVGQGSTFYFLLPAAETAPQKLRLSTSRED